MRTQWKVLATVALLAACPTWARTSAPASEAADRLLGALQEASGVPGLGAAVVHGDVVVWTGSAGLSDVEAGRPVTADTVFRLASVSKLVTATAAARLVEQGRFDVDAPVAPMLPWLKASWAPMTSRQLAAHLSGLPHYGDADRDLGGTHYASVQDAVRIFADRPLESPPGASYRYSSWGYTLLSAVVEARSGRLFLDYVAEAITPGLRIGPDRSAQDLPTVSRIYGFADGTAARVRAYDFSYTWGGGGLAATPESIARFGARLLGGRIVSPRMFEWMLEPARKSDGTSAQERGYAVGFGWRTGLDEDGHRIAHHAGVAQGARSALVLWPDAGVSASLLSNASWVSSIESSTMVLASAFEPASARGQRARPCPVGVTAYEATFSGEPFGGRASFSVQDGLCEGRIELPAGALRTWLDSFPQRDTGELRVIGYDGAEGLAKAAVVTPIGLHRIHVSDAPDTLRVELVPTRNLTLTLH